MDAHEGVTGGAPGHAADLGGADLVELLGGHPDHDQGVALAAPAERGDAGAQRVVAVAAHQGVDHEGLQPGVPGAAPLGGTGVDLSRGERDLAGVAQHGLAQVALAAGSGDPVGVRLDDVDHHTHELQGVLQGDGAGQLGGRGREDLAHAVRRAVRVREPRGEGVDAGLGDEAHVGAVLGGQLAVPVQVLVEAAHRGGGQQAAGLADPLEVHGEAGRIQAGVGLGCLAGVPVRAAVGDLSGLLVGLLGTGSSGPSCCWHPGSIRARLVGSPQTDFHDTGIPVSAGEKL